MSVCPENTHVAGTYTIISSPSVSYQRDRARFFFPPNGFAILLIFITFPSVVSRPPYTHTPCTANKRSKTRFTFIYYFLRGRYAQDIVQKHSTLKRSLIIHRHNKPPRKLIYTYINVSLSFLLPHRTPHYPPALRKPDN